MTKGKALKMAIEAMEQYVKVIQHKFNAENWGDIENGGEPAIKAIKACKEVLAEQEQGSDSNKVAHLMDVYEALGVKWGDDPFRAIERLRNNEQTPVAWMNNIAYCQNRLELPDRCGEEIPLYTRPAQWVGLSEDEILKKQRGDYMKYHYTESGLKSIYLLNGYEVIETPYGKATSIVDVEGLHKLIGSSLCRKKHLTGTEFRFIRKEMGLSQSGLGKTLGVTDQALAKWEKTGRVPKTTDRFIRLLYLESINENIKIQSFIDRINETDRDDHLNMEIETTSSGWKKAARMQDYELGTT